MSAKFNAHGNDDSKGVQLDFSAVPAPAVPGTATDSRDTRDSNDPVPIVLQIGADGRLISANSGTGKDHFSLSTGHGIDAKISGVHGDDKIKFNADGDSALLEVNGEKIPVTVIERDGKHYLSFPWHGHNIALDAACTFKFTSDGDITIDGPAAPK